MVPPSLTINSITRANRDATISLIRSLIDTSGGWLLDVKLFSNVSACFTFEIPTRHLKQFREALSATDLHLTSESQDSFAVVCEPKYFAVEGSPAFDIAGTLQITFIHDEPDLRIEVPSIPG